MSETTTLRRRGASLDDDLARAEQVLPQGQPCITVKVVSAVAGTITVKACRVSAPEIEGGAVVVTDYAGNFTVVNIGTGIPTAGKILIADLIDGNWQVAFNG